MFNVCHDLLSGLRSLGRTPGVTILMLLILAMGLAPMVFAWNVLVANGAMGPQTDPRILIVGTRGGDQAIWMVRTLEQLDTLGPVPWPVYQELSRSVQGFDLVTASKAVVGLAPLEVNGERRTASFAELDARLPAMLGLRAAWGRTFGPGDLDGGEPTGLMFSQNGGSNPLGLHQFGGIATSGRQSFQVLGALADRLPSRALQKRLVFLPFDGNPSRQREEERVVVLARARPGVGLAALRTELLTLSRRLESAYPELKHHPLEVERPETGAPTGLWLSALLVGLPFFLVSSLSVSGLMLARGLRREPELAIHMALGAPRWRLLLRPLGEPIALALGASVLACPLIYWLYGKANPGEGFLVWRPLLELTGIMVLCILATGLLPVLHALRQSPGIGLARGHHTLDRRTARWHRCLCAFQITVAMGLLGISALFIQKARALGHMKACPAEDRLVVVDLPGGDHEDRSPALREWLMRRPEVEELTEGSGPLFFGKVAFPWVEEGSGQVLRIQKGTWDSRYPSVSGLPMLAGRWPDREGECVVSRSLAARLVRDGAPLGQRLRLRSTLLPDVSMSSEVVGVVADERDASPWGDPGAPVLQVIRPMTGPGRPFVVRVKGSARAVAPVLGRALAVAYPDMNPSGVRAIGDRASRGMLWFFAGLLGTLGLYSLLLQGMGLTALLYFIMAQRLREFGIRQAMGASPRRLVAFVLREALSMVQWGLPLGALLTVLGGRLCTFFFMSMPWVDLPSLLGASLVTVLAAVLAALPAARKAALVPAAEVLREL